MRAALPALVLAGCFSKPPRPDPSTASDAGTDGGEVARPRLVEHRAAARAQGSSLAYSITIPAERASYLLVSLHVGTSCEDTAPPLELAEVQLAGGGTQPLGSLARVTGTPCLGNTRSELFELRSPPPGDHTLVLAVAGVAPGLHSAALVFADVDPAAPTRGAIAVAGEGAVSRVSLPSEASDLIVNATAHGTTLERPGANATEVFRTAGDDMTVLDNLGASVAPGTGAPVEMTWEAAALDQWQSLSTALRVAP